MEQLFQSNHVGRFCAEHHDVLETVATLDDQRFTAILTTLGAFSPEPAGFNRPDLIEWLANEAVRVDALSPGRAQELVDALIDLVVMSRVSRLPLADLASDVATEMSRVRHFDAESLTERLHQLLHDPAIFGLAAREDLLSENERVYIDSRIVTDTRPVFQEDEADQPTTVSDEIILHTLRIRFWQEGEERSLIITLRERDIDDLARWIKRAEKKAISLRNLTRQRLDQG